IFMFCRFLAFFFTIATIVLSSWALVGSYKNANYLTNNFLLSFQLNNLNVSALLEEAVNAKRDAIASSLSLPPTLATIAADIINNHSTTNDLLQNIARSVNASQLGLADIYSVSFWGYCKGSINGTIEQNPEIGKYSQLSNKDVTWLYCTPPKVGYTFDPLAILKEELLSAINASALLHTNGPLSSVMSTLSSQLLAVVDLMTYNTIDLPGDLEYFLTLLGNLKDVGFACILAGACLATISLMFQLTIMCCSPNFFCLSCLNFMFMALTLIIVVFGSGLTTGVFIFVRKVLNQKMQQYGIKPFLSVQFYAFSWSAVAAALCCFVFSIIGYCCGCFKSDRLTRISRLRRNEPELKYDHKM
ncbi:hypothetical protein METBISCDRAFT_17050, partial [Metschnikowia bicuspidata]